jgi:hypothetical protein
MFGKKTSIVVSATALLAIGAFGSAALAASAPHRGHAAEARASAPVPSTTERQANDYAWTQSKEPTYMAIQDDFLGRSNSGY